MDKLTAKQRAFVDFYIACGNATEAAINAGYSMKTAAVTACENLKKPNIKSYLETRLAELESEKTATAREVMEYLTSVMRGEQKEEVIIQRRNGQTPYHIEVCARDRIKAAELIGKRHMMWTDKVKVDGVVPVVICNEDKLA